MKIKHLFGLAVIAAMTASCSSNEDLGTAGPGTGNNEAGVGYATFTINLPTTSGTRAANDDFAEGTAKEYAVNDATLVIFEKGTETSENKFKFVETVPLGNLEPWKKDNESTNGITTEATITAKLNSASVGTTDKYYALVILNNKVGTNNKVTLPTSTTTTYGEWNVAKNASLESFVNNKDGFYMANAPEFKATDQEPTTLVKIEGIYRTKEEAQSKPGTTIYVERGLAKVTVGSSSTSTKDYFAEGGANATGNYSSDKVQITKWALDVTNKKSFPVHVTSGLKAGITPTNPTEDQTVPAYANIWKNAEATPGTKPATSRFVSNSTKATFKRVYWGIDPNYSKNLEDKAVCGKEFTLVKADGSDAAWTTSTEPLYCLENTFDIDHMKQGQTTRVVFKATYTPHGFTAGNTFYKIGNNTDIWNKTNLEAQIKTKAQEVLVGKDPTKDATKVTVALNAADNNIEETAGTKILTEDNVLYDGAKVSAEEIKAINEKLGLKDKTATDPIVGIATYASGESYYIARIKHFGDELTPWKAGDATYDGKNLEWLGRYGVLRNNWYDLTVSSISGPGYPDVPEVKPTDPDDENFKYINVSVKILDWAKRSQKVDL